MITQTRRTRRWWHNAAVCAGVLIGLAAWADVSLAQMGAGGGLGAGTVDRSERARKTFSPPRDHGTPGSHLPADLPPETMLEILLASSSSKSSLPGIEALVARAMEIDPRIVSARAELEAAQANIERTRIEVTRQMVEVREQWAVAERVVDHLEGKVKKNPKDEDLIRRYIDARAHLAQIEEMLPFPSVRMEAPETAGGVELPVQRSGVPQAPVLPPISPGPEADPFKVPSPEQKAVNEAIARALDKSVEVGFNEAPLRDVVAYLHDACGVQFVLDGESIQRPPGFGAAGAGGLNPGPEEPKGKGIGSIPVTLHLKGVPLSAVLQAIEDTCDPVRFVVKPYGILVTIARKAGSRGMGGREI